MHIGIKKVVKIIKNNEMPSIPKQKLILNWQIHSILNKYWKLEVDLSNKIHKGNEAKKIKNDIKILKFLMNFSFFDKNSIIIEINGRISKKINKDLLNIKILK